MNKTSKLSYSFPSLFPVSRNWHLTRLTVLYRLYHLGRRIRHKDDMSF